MATGQRTIVLKRALNTVALIAVSSTLLLANCPGVYASAKVPTPAGALVEPAKGGASGSAEPPPPETTTGQGKPIESSATATAGSNADMPAADQATKFLGDVNSVPVKKALVPNHPRHVLKLGAQFLLLDDAGLMPVDNKYGYGLYKDDTRFLSCWDLKIDDRPLTLLYSNTEDGFAGRYVYANTDGPVPREKLLVERNVIVQNGGFSERTTITNFDTVPHDFTVGMSFGADFADMFEVRGQERKKVGTLRPYSFVTSSGEQKASNVIPTDNNGRRAQPLLQRTVSIARLEYQGLDRELRTSTCMFSSALQCSEIAPGVAQGKAKISLRPGASWQIETVVSDQPVSQNLATMPSFADALSHAKNEFDSFTKNHAKIVSDNADLNKWIDKSYRDLFILKQPLPGGTGIAAGVPWFAVAFGRDQEITSLETLPFLPELSRDVLGVLCHYQGTKEDPFTQEKPGRIMHELRLGEMAKLREIPFIPYYGTVDATPLFLMLLGRYVDTTGDIAFAKAHWDNIQRALDFIDKETAQDGYLRYGYDKTSALTNIGWKDSGDSVMYGDGKQISAKPIALVEVQGYLYAAWTSTATLADKLGKNELAAKLRRKAEELRNRFDKDFWNERLHFPALALDGVNRQCDVVSTNPGHVLYTGLLKPERIAPTAARLMEPDMFSGWGIRTLASSEVAYNPLSYHNGSVWPHDNAFISAGFGECDRTDAAARVLSAMFKVAKAQPDWRLPELFCGFDTKYSEKPVWYPVSCSPQAWAAGSVFMMLQGSLGLTVDAEKHVVRVKHPQLPDGVSKLEVKDLSVGSDKVNLTFTRAKNGITCQMSPSTSVSLELTN